MRTFWSLIIVCTLAVLILWLLEERPTSPSPPGPSNQLTQPLRNDRPSSSTASPSEEVASVTLELAGSAQTSSPNKSESEGTSDDTAPAQPTTTLEEQLRTSAELRDDLPEIALADDSSTDSIGTDDADSNTEASQPGLTLGLDKSIPFVTITPGSITRGLSGELDIDDEFTLKGSGTQEDPYLPSWEYLFSAGDTYKPRIGKNDLAQRIALLDGTWVTIAGHTAFPLVVGESSEMLVMLNQWDGCCIGVPPTPFDAIEVRLKEAVKTGPKHSFNYGTVTGRMKVDPYLIENWLVGLYILEQSDLQNDL